MTTQRKEINNEQFFTSFETAKRLAKVIESQSWFSSTTAVIEPSAGDGAWLAAMHVDDAYDIQPKHPEVIEQDFLDPKFVIKREGSILSVGNPPYGRMGKIAKQFINKCADYSDYIAFILPASFAKVTQIRQMPEYFHLVYQEDLLTEAYRFEREGKIVSTIFQIWQRRDEKRIDKVRKGQCSDFGWSRIAEVSYNKVATEIMILLDIKNTETKKKVIALMKESLSQRAAAVPKDADLAICTHGSGAGKVHINNFDKVSSRTHRFIKIKSKIPKEELAKRLRSLDYNSIMKYTVGATCVSTEEIIDLYTQKYPEE
jgi:hypothetical protein